MLCFGFGRIYFAVCRLSATGHLSFDCAVTCDVPKSESPGVVVKVPSSMAERFFQRAT